MSFIEDLTTILSSYHGGYRVMRREMRGYPSSWPKSIKETSENYARVVLSRLKKRGLVKNEKGVWHITEKGREYLRKKIFSRKHSKVGAPHKTKRMIIAFDIPEYKRRDRDWFRIELRNLGFEMLQKSVWFGPAPLPKDFVFSLKEIGILKFIKFFKAEEWDVI